MAWDTILFDLDGTLTDSGPGIMNGVEYAVERLGLPRHERSYYRRFIGPPLQWSFQEFCGLDSEDAGTRIETARQNHSPFLLRRGLEKPAVLFLAAHVRRVYGLRIVADQGEPEELLLKKPGALRLPATVTLTERIKREQQFPFLLILLTVVLGVWIASFF